MSIKRLSGLTAAAVAAVVVLAACADSADQQSGSPTANQTTEPMSSASAAEGEHNDADVMFAQMMIPHHAQAIEMSEIVLAAEGIDSEVTALAERIKAAQTPEIEQMTAWLRAWGEEVPDESGADVGHLGHSSGMMSEQDLEALRAAGASTVSRMFLEQMIEHHRGAVDMAQMEAAEGHHNGATELAQKIIDAQEAEITEMEAMLAG